MNNDIIHNILKEFNVNYEKTKITNYGSEAHIELYLELSEQTCPKCISSEIGIRGSVTRVFNHTSELIPFIKIRLHDVSLFAKTVELSLLKK